MVREYLYKTLPLKLTIRSFSGYPPRYMDSRNGYFKRSTGIKVSDATSSGENPNSLDISNKTNDVESGTDAIKVKVNKKKIRTLTPTSKQLASLNLKEGKNVVIFTFSTAMLGKQQVKFSSSNL